MFLLKSLYQTSSHKSTETSKIYLELILICLAALFGNVLGGIHIPLLNISAGSTACTLLNGLIVGYIMRKKFTSVQVSLQVMNAFRTLGLALFFVGIGCSIGIQSISFNIKTIIYRVFITLTAILFGLLMCKIVFSRHHLNTDFVVACGMTSSPHMDQYVPKQTKCL